MCNPRNRAHSGISHLPACVSLVLVTSLAQALAGPSAAPVELGTIRWLRGYSDAARAAEQQNRPLLVLFQEVPGCSTCVGYGREVLSHPLIAEAAESLFVPVAVYNNVEGDDRQTLELFKEPAWNNPVVRLVTSKGKDIVPRIADQYTAEALVAGMANALQESSLSIPAYLMLLAEEQSLMSRKLETAVFAMHCFWEGEARLGGLVGVVRTRPGFLDEKEVVEVQFDPQTLAYADLLRKAKELQCASRVFTRTAEQQAQAAEIVADEAVRSDGNVRPDKEPKYHLLQSSLKYVPLSPLQAQRVNAALGGGGNPAPLLSPRQAELFKLVKEHPEINWPVVAGEEDMIKAWAKTAAAASALLKNSD